MHRLEVPWTSGGSFVLDDFGESGTEQVTTSDAGDLLVSDGQTVRRLEGWSGERVAEGALPGSLLQTASPQGGSLFVASTDHLGIWDGFLGTSGLDDVLTPPLLGLGALHRDVWVADQRGVQVWREGWLFEVDVDGTPATAPLALGPALAWAKVGDDLVGLSLSEDAIVVTTQVAMPGLQALAASADAAWALADHTLVRVDRDGPVVWDLGQPIVSVLAHARVPGAWVALQDGGWAHLLHGQATALPDQAIRHASADPAGGLLVAGPDGVTRLVPPGGAWVGAVDGGTLTAPATLRVWPSVRARAATLSAWLDDTPLQVDGLAVTLNPEAYPPGPHTLRAELVLDNGDLADVPDLTLVTDGPTSITWDTHIGPLHARACAVCHDDGTETVLAGRADWEAQIDAILDAVSSQRMPLTGAKLTAVEMDRIAQWRDGGFE